MANSVEARMPPATSASVALASSFTALPLVEPLRFWLADALALEAQIESDSSGQVIQALLDPNGALARNSGGTNVVLVRWEDFAGPERGEGIADLLLSALQASAAASRASHLVVVCPPSKPARESGAALRFRHLDRRLASGARALAGVSVVTPEDVLRHYPVPDYDDPVSFQMASIPYTPEMYVAIAAMVARRLYASTAPPYKAVVVDCDNTLWAGVAGEDDPATIVADPPRRALQEFLAERHNAGMLLCLCSRNNESDVLGIFERLPDMPLKLEHVAARRINWEPKPDNLRSLAGELGIGTDSLVFIDDSPLECAHVRAALPEVLTLELPADPEVRPRYLQRVWAFDPRQVTAEDSARSAHYGRNREREALRTQSRTFAAFIHSLDLDVRIRPVGEANFARASQLTLRVNQFNLTTVRRAEAELASLVGSGGLQGFAVDVSDRFGDYGTVGLALYRPDGRRRLLVDTLLLSCRALGRGIEHRMLSELGRVGLGLGLEHVALDFTATPRNRPMRAFLDSLPEAVVQPGESTMYLLPCSAAADIRYDPENAPAPSSGDREHPEPEVRAQEAHGWSRRLERIAAELSEPRAIAEAFDSWRRNAPAVSAAPYVAPCNDVEDRLAALWAEVLGVERVGVRDVFFEHDGDSLKMVQVVVRVLEEFGVELPLEAFFEHPTVEAHARRIVELQESESVTKLRTSGAT